MHFLIERPRDGVGDFILTPLEAEAADFLRTMSKWEIVQVLADKPPPVKTPGENESR
mgnify:CR=1 FL=1